jgi:hypothetical protein
MPAMKKRTGKERERMGKGKRANEKSGNIGNHTSFPSFDILSYMCVLITIIQEKIQI